MIFAGRLVDVRDRGTYWGLTGTFEGSGGRTAWFTLDKNRSRITPTKGMSYVAEVGREAVRITELSGLTL